MECIFYEYSDELHRAHEKLHCGSDLLKSLNNQPETTKLLKRVRCQKLYDSIIIYTICACVTEEVI